MKRISSKSFTPTPIHCCGGFTLMELLVVVSIIGMLASILLPALSGARRRALKTTCISNLHQIGMALSFHADDYRGLHPIAGVDPEWGEKDLPSPPGTGTYGWMYQLFSYVNDKKLYSCPANKEFPDYSYFLSAKAAWIDKEPHGFASVNIRKIQYPTAFVLAGDTTTGSSSPLVDFQPDDCDKDDYTQNCVGGVCWPWTGWQVHMKGQNILFADGHADWFRGYVEGLMTFRYDEIHPWCEPENL